MKRVEAARLGLSRYNTGKPCMRGHQSDRYTATGQCVECQRLYIKNYNNKLKSEIKEARFGAPMDPLVSPRVLIRASVSAQVESFLEGVARQDPRAVNLLALWSLHE